MSEHPILQKPLNFITFTALTFTNLIILFYGRDFAILLFQMIEEEASILSLSFQLASEAWRLQFWPITFAFFLISTFSSIIFFSTSSDIFKISLFSVLGILTFSFFFVVKGGMGGAFLSLYHFGCVLLASIFDEALKKKPNSEASKLIFDSGVKFGQLSLVAFGLGAALLRFYVSNAEQSNFGFVSTFIYYTTAFIISVFVFGVWAVLPAWNSFIYKNLEENEKR